MLILPLHKPLTLGNFPMATMVLVVINVLVFFGWKAGDDARMEAPQGYYQQAGLGEYEVPAYARYLEQQGAVESSAELQAMPASRQPSHVASTTLTDAGFVAALKVGTLFESPEQYQQWLPLLARYQGMLDGVFTLRHILRSSEWSPQRMLSSAFLHGSVMHLLGNMLFLIALAGC